LGFEVRIEISEDVVWAGAYCSSLSERVVRHVVCNGRWSHEGIWKDPLMSRYRNLGRGVRAKKSRSPVIITVSTFGRKIIDSIRFSRMPSLSGVNEEMMEVKSLESQSLIWTSRILSPMARSLSASCRGPPKTTFE